MRKKAALKKVLDVIYPLIGVAIFVLIWYIIALITDIEMILPTPGRTIKELWLLLQSKKFWLAVGGTSLRAIAGFLVALGVAAVLSVISYLCPPVGKIFAPIVVIARAVPTMSIILLAIIWLSAKTVPLLVSFLLVFPVLYGSFSSALNDVDKRLIDISKAFEVPLLRKIFKMYLPYVAPSALDAIRSGISLSIKVTIAGEVLAQTSSSMGINMQISRAYLDTPALLAWTIVAILLGYFAESIVYLIKRITIRWQK